MCQQFIAGVLEAEGININIPETLLRLACTDCDGKEFMLWPFTCV